MSKEAADEALAAIGLERGDVDTYLVDAINRASKYGPRQYERDELKTMSAEQIDQARKDGRLDRIMGRTEEA